MFDSTGVVEMFCQRIDSNEPHPSVVCDEDGTTQPTDFITQERFVVCVFLTERFDWLGHDAVSMKFSLDDGPIAAVSYISRSQCERLPSPRRPGNGTKAASGCFEGLRRLRMESAELQPVNQEGWPLFALQHDVGRIVITLQRGHKVIKMDEDAQQPQVVFYRARGVAGSPVNIVFSYESTYKGLVHTNDTITYVQSALPRLELSRAFAPEARTLVRKCTTDTADGESNTFGSSPPTKRMKLASSDNEVAHQASPFLHSSGAH